ncbi:MAG: response regulator [Ardenticatenaceae bacterium]|nr:response regulator [Ardenticatenaceae bacterium]
MSNPLAIVVEDDIKLSSIYEQTLKSIDFDVEVVNDGQIALDRLAEITPQLIMLDLHLPSVPGDQILSFIRQEDHLSDTRVIVASADGIMAENLPDRADTVLLKPVSIIQLKRLAERFRPAA